MRYRQKNIITTLFLKDGIPVKDFDDHTPAGGVEELIRSFNDNGIDKIILYDLSDDDAEHEKNIHTLKEITLISELPVYAGGNINSRDDVKNILYAGCNKVVLNSLKEQTEELAEASAQRFGKDRVALSVFNVDVFFKQKEAMQEYISEIIVLDPRLAGTMSDVTDIPYSILMEDITPEEIRDTLREDANITGISCRAFCDDPARVPELKKYLKAEGFNTDHLTSTMEWSELTKNPDGLVPVVVQDYQTSEVLMLAYMNEEAYRMTLETGKMTYYSRKREALWIKGETSGHYQYVKLLKVDCDSDTILAKVSQIGAACHTGNKSCFFTDLATDEYRQRNLSEVLERSYQVILERKKNPRSGSYTNYLFEKGIDRIVKKVGEEATDLVIAAKNPDKEDVKYQTADLLYYVMVLMAERQITWEEVLEEMLLR